MKPVKKPEVIKVSQPSSITMPPPVPTFIPTPMPPPVNMVPFIAVSMLFR